MVNEVCNTCGTELDGKVDYVSPNGTKQGRCSKCRRPYVISEAEVEPDPDPVVEPESAVEPEVEPESAVNPTEE